MTADNSIIRIYRVAVGFDGLFLFKEKKDGEVYLGSLTIGKNALLLT